MKHGGILDRIAESDHELLVEDLEEESKGGAAVTDDAADDVDDIGVVEIDPETLAVTQEVKAQR